MPALPAVINTDVIAFGLGVFGFVRNTQGETLVIVENECGVRLLRDITDVYGLANKLHGDVVLALVDRNSRVIAHLAAFPVEERLV